MLLADAAAYSQFTLLIVIWVTVVSSLVGLAVYLAVSLRVERNKRHDVEYEKLKAELTGEQEERNKKLIEELKNLINK